MALAAQVGRVWRRRVGPLEEDGRVGLEHAREEREDGGASEAVVDAAEEEVEEEGEPKVASERERVHQLRVRPAGRQLEHAERDRVEADERSGGGDHLLGRVEPNLAAHGPHALPAGGGAARLAQPAPEGRHHHRQGGEDGEAKEEPRAVPLDQVPLDHPGRHASHAERAPAERLQRRAELRPNLGALGDGGVNHHVGHREVDVCEEEEEAGERGADGRGGERGQHAESEEPEHTGDKHVRRPVHASKRHRVGQEAKERFELPRDVREACDAAVLCGGHANVVEQIVLPRAKHKLLTHPLVDAVGKDTRGDVAPAKGRREAAQEGAAR
mmetsp:Transcript_38924/g.125818  ORF Transcript_38924/g.125818 Transcript_38924/m.125818 type:complete len:328 (+) Transcript_38924:992-1975(+)